MEYQTGKDVAILEVRVTQLEQKMNEIIALLRMNQPKDTVQQQTRN
jgi:hypothetical protein